jgi:hypothetical protein
MTVCREIIYTELLFTAGKPAKSAFFVGFDYLCHVAIIAGMPRLRYTFKILIFS